MIVPSSASDLDRAARFAERHHRAHWLVIDDRSPVALREAADAARWVDTQDETSAHTLDMLAQTGLPIVADRTPNSERISNDRITLCDASKELEATTGLFKELVRGQSVRDIDAFVRELLAMHAGEPLAAGV